MSSKPTNSSTVDYNSAELRDKISFHAYLSGLKYGATVAGCVGTAVLLANTYSPKFRSRLGISGKWGLVVSSFLASSTIESDQRILAGARNPKKYLEEIEGRVDTQTNDGKKKLKLYQRTANFLYDHPYRSLITVGVPLVGGIYVFQRTNKAIQASQQIMHTRIYGQGAVVVLLLSSMAFHDYMAKHGRFEVEDDEEDKQETQHVHTELHHH
uniref:HIG1 domain-containing protein n=1 Tax=Globisporangium ultimum (strain ATCC 200006 / CBS 805.95 / DAOM BR144) TaxID=431595 RepID=K3XB90_GLOUD